MTNIYMDNFKKRLIKGLLLGVAMVVFIIIYSVVGSQNPFSELPWYLVPVVLVLTVLYGTGWYFAFNLIKRAWRKFLRVNRDATIWQALTGHGIWMGLLYSMLCFIGGCFLAFIVGNFFMVKDYLLAKRGQPPVSMKYKFDSDLEYNNWADSLEVMKQAVRYNDVENNTSAEHRMKNEFNMQNIEDGRAGHINVTVKDGNKRIDKKIDIYENI